MGVSRGGFCGTPLGESAGNTLVPVAADLQLYLRNHFFMRYRSWMKREMIRLSLHLVR